MFCLKPLINRLREFGTKIGTATSVMIAEWDAARIYSVSSGSLSDLTKVQEDDNRLFRFVEVGTETEDRERAILQQVRKSQKLRAKSEDTRRLANADNLG